MIQNDYNIILELHFLQKENSNFKMNAEYKK